MHKMYQMMKKQIDEAIEGLIPDGVPFELSRCMKYGLRGGKRLRPMLFLAVLRAYGITPSEIDLKAACAIECIHAYSLIHDDLPSMDNDDYRRGEPSCHKAFGESTALLAGDGLLNLAFELLFKCAEADARYIKILGQVSKCSGAQGMIGGQFIEFTSDYQSISADGINYINSLKTGKLIDAAILSGCIAAGKAADLSRWEEFSHIFGRAFQLRDDLLDCDKDIKSLAHQLGERAEAELTQLSNNAISVLSTIECDSTFICGLTKLLLFRETDEIN